MSSIPLIAVPGPKSVDMVNHPPHYKHPCGVETIVMSEHAVFAIGNAIKYVLRHDKKGTPLLDLEKAEFYLKRYESMSVVTPVWVSAGGEKSAKYALNQVITWESERWWPGHPLVEFYIAMYDSHVDEALKQVGYLIKLNGGQPNVPA